MDKAAAIDLDYRPETYWTKSDNLRKFISRILGEERRLYAEQLEREGRFVELEGWLLESKLPEDLQDVLARAHPRFMSGEFLPELLYNEAEIVRIRLASVTGDVTSIRARWDGSSIAYRVVDEYDHAYRFTTKPSALPLSLGELVRAIDSARMEGEPSRGLVGIYMKYMLAGGFDDAELPHSFVRFHSRFYPQLNRVYADRIRRMVQRAM